MLPIGALIPTRNAASYLPEHLAAMREWLPHVQEVVVVDSFSKDGTLELIKSEVRHPALKVFQHPPGLYQSWNYGIQQIQAEYCYISTIGEAITLDGLQHLADVAARLRCDVVISQPNFITEQGAPMGAPPWPIADILRSLAVTEPIVLEGAALFFFALLDYGNAFLGSSASNLYRTRSLQENPFPSDYGTAGDGGWGLTNCLKIRLGVTSRRFSTFREHPKSYSRAEYAVDQLVKKFFDRICQTYRSEAGNNPRFAAVAGELQVEKIVELLETKWRYQQQLEYYRRDGRLWVLHPAAWLARVRRDAKAQEVAQLKAEGVRILRSKYLCG
jgi:glycosyltransferase involved in cell wall biosynthesis